MCKQIIAVLISLPCLLTAIESDSLHFRNEVLIYLHNKVGSGEPVYSSNFFEDFSQKNYGTEEQLKIRLSNLIKTIEKDRKKNSDLWRAVISKGSPEIEPNRAKKLIKQWIKEIKKILESDQNHLLDQALRKAARKSKVPFFQSKSYLLSTLAWARSDSQKNALQKPFGILVSGKSDRYEINIDPILLFFGSREEEFVREQVRDIHRFITPSLVRILPKSKHILWCVRKRESNALVIPDYELIFNVENFSFTGSNVNIRPCIELEIEIFDWKTKSLLSRKSFSECSHQSDSSHSKSLSPFWDEIANAIRDLVILEVDQ